VLKPLKEQGIKQIDSDVVAKTAMTFLVNEEKINSHTDRGENLPAPFPREYSPL